MGANNKDLGILHQLRATIERGILSETATNHHRTRSIPTLELELKLLKMQLGQSMSKHGAVSYTSMLRSWFKFLGGSEPTVEGAREFLESRIKTGYSLVSLYKYKRAIERYFELKGIYAELSYPVMNRAISDPRTKKYRDGYLGRYIDGKFVWIEAPGKRARPDYCELCGKNLNGASKTLLLSYHHWDNDDLSKGLWLCVRCHKVAEAAEDGITTEQYIRLKQSVQEEKTDILNIT